MLHLLLLASYAVTPWNEPVCKSKRHGWQFFLWQTRNQTVSLWPDASH